MKNGTFFLSKTKNNNKDAFEDKSLLNNVLVNKSPCIPRSSFEKCSRYVV